MKGSEKVAAANIPNKKIKDAVTIVACTLNDKKNANANKM